MKSVLYIVDIFSASSLSRLKSTWSLEFIPPSTSSSLYYILHTSRNTAVWLLKSTAHKLPQEKTGFPQWSRFFSGSRWELTSHLSVRRSRCANTTRMVVSMSIDNIFAVSSQRKNIVLPLSEFILFIYLFEHFLNNSYQQPTRWLLSHDVTVTIELFWSFSDL